MLLQLYLLEREDVQVMYKASFQLGYYLITFHHGKQSITISAFGVLKNFRNVDGCSSQRTFRIEMVTK